MIIYLIRHAESAPREGMNHEEGKPVGLSLFGRTQARILAKKLKKIGVDKITVSPLGRTKETAEILRSTLRVLVGFDERLEEYAPSRTLVGKLFKEAKKKTREDWNFIPKNGESLNHSTERFIKSITEIMESGVSAPCVVSHALIIQNTLMKLFSFKTPPVIDEVSITALRYENSKFELLYLNKSPSRLLTIISKIRKKLKTKGLWD